MSLRPEPPDHEALSPAARAVAYALRAGDREAAEQGLLTLKTEAPQEALAHFIDAQLAFSAGEWRRLVLSARRCWQLGGQDPWVGHVLGGVALRCGLTELSTYLEGALSDELEPLTQLSDEQLPELTRALTAPLPPVAASRLTHKPPQGASGPQGASDRGHLERPLTRLKTRSPLTVNLQPPDWIDRSLKQPFSASRDDLDLTWLNRSSSRSSSRSSHATLQLEPLPDWMSVGSSEDGSLAHGQFATPAGLSQAHEEGLSAGLTLCETLELPMKPLLALPLPAPTLHQAQQEPRRLKGRFLLVAYPEGLGLIDLSKPSRPWHFKKTDLDEIRVEQLVGQWSMSVIFSDMRVIHFEVAQGVSGSLEPYHEGGDAFKRWLLGG